MLPLEQFAVGGVDTVRGYRENELVGDNGFAATLELRDPLWRGNLLDQPAELQGALFADAGSAWLKGWRSEAEILYGVGVGLLGSWGDHAHAELYWAHALSAVPKREDYDLQDDGIYFLVGLAY